MRLLFCYLARLLFIIFITFTSFYCLLAYIPFTYQQVVKLNLVDWLPIVIKYYPLLYWLVLSAVCLTLKPDLTPANTRRLTLGFIGYHTIVGCALIVYPLLARLENNIYSLWWSFVPLISLGWLTLIDYRAYFGQLVQHSAQLINDKDINEDRRLFFTALITSFFLTALYTVIYYLRVYHNNAIDLRVEIFALIWRISAHLLIFMIGFVALNLSRAIARYFKSQLIAELLLAQLLLTIYLAIVVKNIVLIAISFNNRVADVFAVIVSLVLIAAWNGLGLRLYQWRNDQCASGIVIILRAFAPCTEKNLARCWLCLLAIIAITLALYTPGFDWNFLLQKLTIALLWPFVFSSCYWLNQHQQRKLSNTKWLLILPLFSLFIFKSVQWSETKLSAFHQHNANNRVLAQHSNYDISLRLLGEILEPINNDAGFYKYLQLNTNISQQTSVAPVEIKLVDQLAPITNSRPNIFIFVIDSLRQDYLGAYNAKVNFTPAIDQFAKDSIRFENAFTRYGATGLSEPSIWTGSMQLHKQYITPFYPMNSLQKLIRAGNYQSYLSLDSILRTIVEPSSDIIELDPGINTQDLELCRTIAQLEKRLSNTKAANRPIFSYTQPQNIHVSVINRAGRSVPSGEAYPGFFSPYAARVKQLDGCFGEFINFLRGHNLYDNSIIIFTADHGDSLGENGRFGHAYTIFPEVLRIPLIIHLPASMRERLQWDTQALTFSTDITPSLYYLLGQQPIIKNRIFGRPLFTATRTELNNYLQEYYLVASSYGPVYGIIKNNGRSLYIADGINFRDYFYDLDMDSKATINFITPAIKAEHESLIRREIESIGEFYHFKVVED